MQALRHNRRRVEPPQLELDGLCAAQEKRSSVEDSLLERITELGEQMEQERSEQGANDERTTNMDSGQQ
jgi:hypothetical protein